MPELSEDQLAELEAAIRFLRRNRPAAAALKFAVDRGVALRISLEGLEGIQPSALIKALDDGRTLNRT